MRYTDAGTAATRCFSSWYDLEYNLLQLVFLFNSLLVLFWDWIATKCDCVAWVWRKINGGFFQLYKQA